MSVEEKFGVAVVGSGLCIMGCIQILLYCVESGINWHSYPACGMGWVTLFMLFLTGACMFLIYVLWYVMHEMGK